MKKINNNSDNWGIIFVIVLIVGFFSWAFFQNIFLVILAISIPIGLGIYILSFFNREIYFDQENLFIKCKKSEYSFPLIKITKVKLTLSRVGSSRKYRIVYINKLNQYDSLEFYVARWNMNFERFIDHMEENYPNTKIERWAHSFNS